MRAITLLGRATPWAPIALLLGAGCATTPPSTSASSQPATAGGDGVGRAAEAREAASVALSAPEWKDAASIAAKCAERQGQVAALRARVKAETTRTLERVLVPTNELYALLDTGIGTVNLMANVHPDKGAREAAERCEQQLRAVATELTLDRGLYDVIAGVAPSGLDAEARRFMEKFLRDFKRSGVDKDDRTRARLKEIQDELVKVGQDFTRNIRDDVRKIEVDAKELAGLPEDFVSAHKPNAAGKLELTTNYPDLFPVQTYAQNEGVRRRLFVANATRAEKTNEPVLRRMLALRAEYAALLGYKSWADYQAEDKMVKSAQNIEKLIADLSELARPRMEREQKQLLARKRKDDAKASTLEYWDRFFYVEKLRSENFQVDSKEVRQYFDFTAVTKGIFDLYGELFGVRFVPTTSLPVWHESVLAYELFQGDRRIGRFYLDLHPREGKYNHAAEFGMVTGLAGGPEPMASLVCNFPDPSKTSGPALMEHGDVRTYFHEFGHLIHHLLAQSSRWVNLNATNVEQDFVEAPSQLLEEWVWDVAVLQRFAKNVKGEPIPAALVEKMRRAEELGKGMHVMRQLHLTATSYELHAQDPKGLDLDRFAADVAKRYSPYPFVAGTRDWASFGHLEGYSSMYYTYQWSLVIAKDIFTRFAKAGLLDPKTARDYRDLILAKGGMKDAGELVRDFLGRESNLDAYKTWIERD